MSANTLKDTSKAVALVQPKPTIGEAFYQISNVNLMGGMKTLSQVGGHFIKDSSLGISGLIFKSELENKTLKTHQKILPMVGKGLVIGTTAAAATVMVAGASFLVPPFMFVASTAGAVRSFTDYRKAKDELRALNRELISKSDLEKQIDKTRFSPEAKEQIKQYAFGKNELYLDLYKARKQVIEDGSLSLAQKQDFVAKLNQGIENINQNKINNNDLNINILLAQENLPAAIKKDLENTQNKVSAYEQAANKIVNLPSKLQKNVDAYRLTREKIYSQDLPEKLKAKMDSTLEQKSISRDTVKNVYAQMSNHFINAQPNLQANLLDKNFQEKLNHYPLNDVQKGAVAQFISNPRAIYNSMQDLKESINTLPASAAKEEGLNKITELSQDYLKKPNAFSPDAAQFAELKKSFPELSEKITATQADIKKHAAISSQFFAAKKLGEMSPAESGTLKNSIQSHQLASLNLVANNPRADFAAPEIKFDISKHDLYEKKIKHTALAKFTDKLLNKIGKGFDDKKPIKVKDAAVKQARGENYDKFTAQYAGCFDTFEKMKRKSYVEDASKKLLANAGICTAVAGISAATTFVMPAAASPGAPATVALGAGLMAGSLALSGASLAISANLMAKEELMQRRMASAKDKAGNSVSPDINYEMNMQAAAKKQQTQAKAVAQMESELKNIVSSPKKTLELLARLNGFVNSGEKYSKSAAFSAQEAARSDKKNDHTMLQMSTPQTHARENLKAIAAGRNKEATATPESATEKSRTRLK